MKNQNELLQLVKQIQALAETGLHYSEIDYDLDRYQNLEEIALRMLSLVSGISDEMSRMPTPLSASSEMILCTSALAPTSIPRVGSSRMRT